MTDLTERVNFLLANSEKTTSDAMKFVAECFELGVAASAYRDDVHRARRITSGLRIVSADIGGKDEESGQ